MVSLRQSMVGLGRVELPTSPLSGVRSNQLSYRPKLVTQAGRSPRRLFKLISQEPGGSHNPHSVLKGFRGQRLNMLGSYATHDHHANARSSKEGLYQDSRACRQERLLRVRWRLTFTVPDSHQERSALAEGI